MTELTKKKCEPCEGKGHAYTREQAGTFLSQVPGWKLTEDARGIFRSYELKDFNAAVAMVNAIAKIAETEGHHPDLHLTGYKRLRVDLSTHAVGGLSENDFILAAKINELKGT